MDENRSCQGINTVFDFECFPSCTHADLLVSQSCLRVSTGKNDVHLSRNSKGLFIVKLSELPEAARTQSRGRK